MEVAVCAPPKLRKGTPLPLRPLVEDTRSKANIPNHLLESKIYVKLKSNSLIEVEPSELHFSRFELGKHYLKSLKLINITSEALNIHIIPTQTRYFQTTYTKKDRLIPGLAYTVKIQFSPDEWRYFYDCVRVHCQGEENLLIPVHAYPIIDDLHFPLHVDLPPVKLGHSVSHSIPLKCSCPVEFEFQVDVLEPHDTFSICPLKGVIPARGQEEIMVTFTPTRYETAHVTIQLVISQFRTKPYFCTIVGNSTPQLALSQFESVACHGEMAKEITGSPPSPAIKAPFTKKKRKSAEEAKTKMVRNPTGVKAVPKPQLDVFTPAGVAKMLIRDTEKLSPKQLREAISCSSMVGLKNRQMKEVFFTKKLQQNFQDEQEMRRRGQVYLGKDPLSEDTRSQILEEREIVLHEYKVKQEVREDEEFASGEPKLSVQRVLCEAGQAPKGSPSFQFHSSFLLELKQRALRGFQQAARKVVIQCRMNRRLASLKDLTDSLKTSPLAQKEEPCNQPISPERVFPSSFPVFANDDDPLASGELAPLPVDPIDVHVTPHVPVFKLQVPQHYKLMGYRPMSAWEAYNLYIPSTLARPLRTGPPPETGERQHEIEEEVLETTETGAHLTFSIPDALLKPVPAHPLRIFNPAPGLQSYKPTPKYLDSDLEFHLCPLPRYSTPGADTSIIKTPTLHTQRKLLDRKDVIKGVMTWKNFDQITSKCLSNQSSLTSIANLRRSIDYSTDILPLAAPPPLTEPPGDLVAPTDKQCEGVGIQLTAQMIRAEFLSGDPLVSNSNIATGGGATGQASYVDQRERQMEETEFNQMGKRVMDKLRKLGVTDRAACSSSDCE